MIRTALLALAVAAPVALRAQVKPPPQRPATPRPVPGALDQRPGQRAAVRDTTAPDTAVKWSPPDSVMQELLRRSGDLVTRYEGDVVTFDARSKTFAIVAGDDGRAQVEREGQRVVTDSVVVYRDSSRSINVSGRFQISPGGGQPPIAGSGTADYNLSRRGGRLTNAAVTVPDEGGDRWFIRSQIGKMALGDSARGIPTRFYGVGGSLTSCEDSVPDYHFRLREIKRTEKTLVARPAVMYIQDIPVMWLPFVFQDIRSGRRSGVLPPRLGASDIVRNNPSYRRHVENLGYYWALNDYMDATMWVDWRSSMGGDTLDPGWYRVNAEWKYTVLTRFLQGRLATAYTRQRNGLENTAVSWGHQQRLGRNRTLTTNVNYVSSTRLQRQNTFNPYQAMATIRSSFSFADKIGPASLQLGGGRTQFPGRESVDQEFPSLSLSMAPLSLASWLIWTPSFSFRETASLRIDQPSYFSTRYVADDQGRLIRVDTLERNRYDRTLSFETPLRVFGFDFRNGVSVRDRLEDYPNEIEFYVNADSAQRQKRVFRRTFRTDVDWNPTFSLPPLLPTRFKVTPSVSLQNVDPGPFWVRTPMSGGRFVAQSKRLVYGVSTSPTVYGLWPGFGPFQRFRHAISPVLSYHLAPRAKAPIDYLEATGQRVQGYLGTLPQSAISLSLSQNIEAKVRAPSDTAQSPDGGQKLKILSMQFTPLSYDFERARATGRKLAGVTTETFGTRVTSDLLPGMDISVDYSLFQGSTLSDTAEFDPFLTRVASTFRIGQRENPFTVIARLFGRPVADQSPAPQPGTPQPQEEAGLARQIASQPVAGQAARGAQFVVPPGKGWEATFSFSTSRFRPPKSDRVVIFDPKTRCEQFRLIDPFAYERCLQTPSSELPFEPLTAGSPAVLMPPQTSLSGSLNFELTPKWAAAWQTSYDFEERQFASQVVSLQRDLHDWRAIFAFTKSPNGNFAFNFFIALKPQPDLKFDYSRASVRGR